MTISVADLSIAPVKGLRLVSARELDITPTGPAGDRVFVVVDAERRLVLTTRTPALLQVAPSWDSVSRTLKLRFPDGREVVEEPALGDLAITARHNGRALAGRLVHGSLSEALSDHLGRPIHLLALEPGQTGADDYPVTLMSTASLAALGEALPDGTPDSRRFRMTVTVHGTEPWEEHGWSGRRISLGQAVLRVADPVPRCVVTTHHPEAGSTDVPVLRGLAAVRGARDVTFGVWCEVEHPGTVRLGDTVVAE